MTPFNVSLQILSPLQPAAERARRRALFLPAYEQLAVRIQGRVAYPQGFESWREDEKKDFKVLVSLLLVLSVSYL